MNAEHGDPTAFDLGGQGSYTDPLTRRLTGRTAHGGYRLDMPFMTELAPNLWQGGVEHGLVLPKFIKHIVSLYPWGAYRIDHQIDSDIIVTMYDSLEQGFEQVDILARWVNLSRESGPVLVHCQAGLNRSSLVVARALMLSGEVSSGDEAVEKLRAARSQACLCNPAFEKWVREQPLLSAS